MDTKYFSFFFFNDTATTEIYTLSLHDALPILVEFVENEKKKFENSKLSHEEILKNAYDKYVSDEIEKLKKEEDGTYNIIYEDRKSTRLNSSHANISYAVFCLKKKKKKYLCNGV